MLYKLEISYKYALEGGYLRSSGYDAIGWYFAQRGATVIHDFFHAPKIDFMKGDAIENISDLLKLAHKKGYNEVVIKLDGDRSQDLITQYDRLAELHDGNLSLVDADSDRFIRADFYAKAPDWNVADFSEAEFNELLEEVLGAQTESIEDNQKDSKMPGLSESDMKVLDDIFKSARNN